MNPQLKSNLLSAEHWLRFVYMALFVFCLYIASMVMVVTVVAQFIFALVTGNDNTKLCQFGKGLSLYIQQVLFFVTYNSDEKAFPFSDLPCAVSYTYLTLPTNSFMQ